MTSLPSRDSSRSRNLRAFWAHLLRALPVIAVTTVLTTAAHHFHLNDSFEFAALDVYLATAAPRTADDVVIVTITDDDYRSMFAGRSPLAPAKLRALVELMLSQSPAALGVDVVTTEPEHAEAFAGFTDARVVWVQDAWNDPVLGRSAAGANAGFSLFPLDADRVVRRYYRQLAIETDQGHVTRPSFAAAILRTYCASRARPECERVRDVLDEDASEPLWFNFAGDRYSFRKIPVGAVEQAPDGLFKDKIVLLGGTFAAARDVHSTVLGEMFGVELTAFAVESELGGGGITASNEFLMIAAEILSAIVLVWLNWRWPRNSLKMAVLNGAAIVILAFAGSYFAFRRFGYWASFVPIGLGVRAHLNHERSEAVAHDRRELEEYRRRYGSLVP